MIWYDMIDQSVMRYDMIWYDMTWYDWPVWYHIVWYNTQILTFFFLLWFNRYPDREAMVTDACVPLSRLSDLISTTREALDKSWLPAPIIAHAGKFVYYCWFKYYDRDEYSYVRKSCEILCVRKMLWVVLLSYCSPFFFILIIFFDISRRFHDIVSFIVKSATFYFLYYSSCSLILLIHLRDFSFLAFSSQIFVEIINFILLFLNVDLFARRW